MEAIEQPATKEAIERSRTPTKEEKQAAAERVALKTLIRRHPEVALDMRLTDSELWAYKQVCKLKSVTFFELATLQSLHPRFVQSKLDSLVAKGYLQQSKSRYEVMPEISQ